MTGWSSVCCRLRVMESDGRGTGWTWPGTERTRRIRSNPGFIRTATDTGTGWSRRLTADMPYDRFLVEQIAADVLDEPGKLERLPALGFFACGPVYYGDSKKYDQIDDRIDTLCRGVLGLTVACARCHDHKYDPIPTADYYALAGVFASTEYEEAALVSKEVVEAYDRGQEAIARRKRRSAMMWKRLHRGWPIERAREISKYLMAAWTWENRRASDPKASVEQVAREHSVDAEALQGWRDYLAKRAENRRDLREWARIRKEHPPKDALNRDTQVGPQMAEAAEAFELAVLDVLERTRLSRHV